MYGTLISSVTVGAGGAASMNFTSIPGSYTDLILVMSVGTTGSSSVYKLQFNSDTASNYPFIRITGDGASVATAGATLDGIYVGNMNNNNFTANTFTNGLAYIPNYAGSSSKSVSTENVMENNGTTGYCDFRAHRWTGTSTITSISITPASGTFSQYSTAYLYGLLKGSGGATAA